MKARKITFTYLGHSSTGQERYSVIIIAECKDGTTKTLKGQVKEE